jgi:2-keto-4-pentenoate hydratase/2-oxohepta-3-ene-1,7-dioic acid hydratase in catechol pathway
MKIIRFKTKNGPKFGILRDKTIWGLKLSPFDPGFSVDVPILDNNTYDLSSTVLLAPCEPSKYLGVGFNYAAVLKKLGIPVPEKPIVFIKPSTSIVGPGDKVFLPAGEAKIVYEGELALVIGKKAKNVREDSALDHILGCTCTNDVSDISKFEAGNGDPLLMKALDTFGPIGPCIDTEVNPEQVTVRTWVNGKLRQEGNTRDLIFGIRRLVSYLSRIMTLLPGDVIATGTPPGSAPVNLGDTVTVEVEGVGVLENRMAKYISVMI